jgi:hypothetical protein
MDLGASSTPAYVSFPTTYFLRAIDTFLSIREVVALPSKALDFSLASSALIFLSWSCFPL